MSIKAPDFIRPFDGTQPVVSAIERDVVAEKFTDVLDGFFAQHSGAVLHWDSELTDFLKVHVPRGLLSKWEIALMTKTSEVAIDTSKLASEQNLKSANLVATSPLGGYAIASFHLDIDGVVRRTDEVRQTPEDRIAESRAIAAIAEESRLNFTEETDDRLISLNHVLASVDYWDKVKINRELAEQMGFYNQPIGEAEVDGFLAMLHHPRARVIDISDTFSKR